MIAGRRMFYLLLTLYAHAIAADEQTSYQVNAMNDILTHPGWKDSPRFDGYQIQVRWMGGGERILNIRDLMQTGADGRRVNSDNVKCKIRQAHQHLSCQYARNLKMCYDFNVDAVHQCKRIVCSPSGLLRCVRLFMDMIRNIDQLLVRYQGTLSGIQKLCPEIPFDEGASNAMKDFKSYYDHLTVNKYNYDAVLNFTEKNMNTTRLHLRKFYKQFCTSVSDQVENGFSEAARNVQDTDDRFTPFEIMKQIKILLDLVVKVEVREYDEEYSVGFEYDSEQKRVSIKYKPDSPT